MCKVLITLLLGLWVLTGEVSAETLPILDQHFAGGIAVNGQAHQQTAVLKLSDTVDVTGNITVDPADVGKTADIFVYAEATLPPSTETVYFMLGEGLTISLWDKNPNNLVAFQPNVTLGTTQAVSMYSGNFVYPGTLKVYFGYRLASGTLVTNPEPIRVTISNKGEPQFRGLVQVTSTDTDKVTLAWLPATDDNTPSETITYQVHLSDQANFAPSNATLQTAVTGQQQTEVSGLATGHTYNVLVVAVDQEGNESVERDYRTATTFSEPVIVSQTTSFAEDKNLGLGEATTADGVQFTYPSGGTLPQVGSVLFANVGEDMYLRKVDSVNSTANGGIMVQTSDAELTDLVEQGEINSEVTLFDVNDEVRRAEGRQSGVRTSRAIRNDGQHVVMRWENNTLVAEQTDYNNSGTDRSTRDNREEDKNEEKVKIKANIGFQPSIKPHIRWKWGNQGPMLISGRVTAKGQLKASLEVSYDFKGADSVQKKFTLFKRKMCRFYILGGQVPVFQCSILSLEAEVKATASSEINAKAGAKASAAIEMSAVFNPKTNLWEFTPITPSFEKSVTEDISVHGSVHGEVRLIPNLQTEFYRVVASDASAEPILASDIGVETLAHADFLDQWTSLKTQLTQFDIYLQVQAFIGVSLRIFSKQFSVLEKTQIWESPKWQLFSLPQLSVADGSGKVDEPITLAATTKDGVNNPFNEGSVQWDVYPPGKATVSGGKTGSFTASEEGTYTVFFSGASRIPAPLGRQFVSAEVSVAAKDEKPKAAHGIPDRCLDTNKLCLKDVVPNRCNTLAPGAYGSTVKIKQNGQEVEVKDGQWTYVPKDDTSSNGIYTVETYSLGILNGFHGGWSIVDCTPGAEHGNYINGKKDGVWYDISLMARINQVFGMVTWSNGTIEGPAGTWYSIKNSDLDCSPKYYGSYKNGKQDGVSVSISGYNRFTESNYVDGILDGPTGSWTPSSLGCRPVDYHGTFVKGKHEGVWIWIYEGRDDYNTDTFVNDVLQGPHDEWKADGSPRGCHGNYASGKKVGVWTCYKDDGTTYTETYVDGVKQ